MSTSIILGGIGYAVGGPLGYQIGATIGGMLEQGALTQEVGKLSDRRVTGSSYGAEIPRVWGRARLGGHLIWCAVDANGDHLRQSVKRSGGGKKPKVKKFSYSATFAMMFCSGQITFPDGGSVNRGVSIKKAWFDDKMVFDSDEPSSIVYDDLTWYEGSESQAPDPLIVADRGGVAANVCAHRGFAYAVFDDVTVEQRLPSVEAIVETDPCTYGDVLRDIMRMEGIPSARIDMSAVTDPCEGFVWGSRSPGQDAINLILQALPVDIVSINGVLTGVRRGGASVRTILEEHLGAGVGSPTERVRRKYGRQTVFPGRFEVQYVDADSDLQAAVQSDIRVDGDAYRVESLALPMAMSAGDARGLAGRKLDEAWISDSQVSISLPMTYAELVPTDPVTVRGERMRIVSMERAPVGAISLELVPELSTAIEQSSSGSSGGTGSGTVSTPVPTAFRVWSGVSLSDSDATSAGFYVVGAGGSGWTGGTIYYSSDGTDWVEAGSVTEASAFGVTTSALSDSGATAESFDDANTVSVDVSASGQLVISATDAEIAAGENFAVIGSELIGVGVASVVSAGNYTLSHLLRGARGSSMTGHTSGEQVAFAGTGAVFVPVDVALVGATLQVKVVSPYQVLGDVTARTVVIATPATDAVSSLAAVAEATVWESASISTGSAETSWATVDLSGSLPEQARSLIVFASIRNGGSGVSSFLVRASATDPEIEILRIKADSDVDESGAQAVIPLGPGRTFDFRVVGTDAIAWQFLRVGYRRSVG